MYKTILLLLSNYLSSPNIKVYSLAKGNSSLEKEKTRMANFAQRRCLLVDRHPFPNQFDESPVRKSTNVGWKRNDCDWESEWHVVMQRS